MPEDKKALGGTMAILKTVDSNLIIAKSRGADVRLRPKKSRLRTYWGIAYGFVGGGFLFFNSKAARKKLTNELGEPTIELTVRFFGKPKDIPAAPLVEDPEPSVKTCPEFFCRHTRSAFGFLPDIGGEGIDNQGGLMPIKITRVIATARVTLGGETVFLKVDENGS